MVVLSCWSVHSAIAEPGSGRTASLKLWGTVISHMIHDADPGRSRATRKATWKVYPKWKGLLGEREGGVCVWEMC